MNISWQIISLLTSAVVAAIISAGLRPLARRWGVIDDPAKDPLRKRHQNITPLLGGWAIILATWITWGILWLGRAVSPAELPAKYFFGLMAAGLVIGVIGYLDDRFLAAP